MKVILIYGGGDLVNLKNGEIHGVWDLACVEVDNVHEMLDCGFVVFEH